MHYARNLLALVPKAQMDMVAAVFRTIFAQPDPESMSTTWDQVRDQLAARLPKIAPHMDDAKAEVLAFNTFPRVHWPELGHRSAILASVGAVTCGDAVAWCFV